MSVRMRYLPALTLISLAVCVAVMQGVEKPEPQPRCEYMDGEYITDIPVSSEKECERIHRARKPAND